MRASDPRASAHWSPGPCSAPLARMQARPSSRAAAVTLLRPTLFASRAAAVFTDLAKASDPQLAAPPEAGADAAGQRNSPDQQRLPHRPLRSGRDRRRRLFAQGRSQQQQSISTHHVVVQDPGAREQRRGLVGHLRTPFHLAAEAFAAPTVGLPRGSRGVWRVQIACGRSSLLGSTPGR